MSKYLFADLMRLLKRVPLWIVLGIYAAATVLILDISVSLSEGVTSVQMMSIASTMLELAPLTVGIMCVTLVYGDDFKSRIMQVAIGGGISRNKIILMKLIESAILSAFEIIVIILTSMITSAVMGYPFAGTQVRDIFVEGFTILVMIIGYVSITQILMFLRQGTGLAVLLFISLSMGLISELFSLLELIKPLQKMHIGSYTFTSLSEVFATRLALGHVNFGALIGVILYIGISFLLTALIYRKRELEF